MGIQVSTLPDENMPSYAFTFPETETGADIFVEEDFNDKGLKETIPLLQDRKTLIAKQEEKEFSGLFSDNEKTKNFIEMMKSRKSFMTLWTQKSIYDHENADKLISYAQELYKYDRDSKVKAKLFWKQIIKDKNEILARKDAVFDFCNEFNDQNKMVPNALEDSRAFILFLGEVFCSDDDKNKLLLKVLGVLDMLVIFRYQFTDGMRNFIKKLHEESIQVNDFWITLNLKDYSDKSTIEQTRVSFMRSSIFNTLLLNVMLQIES
ncbi:hypothetical protein MHBO_001210 [Bonamia ostreae]|uniref:Uncharacterized protein n=1 Tax=Bonamia ostreae TaxID=126728 RepID=A0ABV2AIT2_9EUKA